jgi:4-hydroxythreonine-4-phosphate dehydrogenase
LVPEITLKALAENKKIQKEFVLLGDGNFYEGLIKKLNLDLTLLEEGSLGSGISFKHFPLSKEVKLGKPDLANANYIIEVLSYGALGCLSKKFKGLITGPINKELINQSGFEFSGHTEFLADISNVKKVVMLLMNEKLKIALLTTHIPLSEVPAKVTQKNLEDTVEIISYELENT